MAAVAVKNQSVRKKRKSPRRKEPLHGFAAKARESGIAERFDRLSDSVLLTEPETAEVTGRSANSLKAWRLSGKAEDKGKGPPALKMPGTECIRYRVGAVRTWLSNLSK